MASRCCPVFGRARRSTKLKQENDSAGCLLSGERSGDQNQETKSDWFNAVRLCTAVINVECDFQPSVDDEVQVRKGQKVTALYREDDWLYVSTGDDKEGFIPTICCSEYTPATHSSPCITLQQNCSSVKSKFKTPTEILKKSFSGSLLRNKSKSQEFVSLHDNKNMISWKERELEDTQKIHSEVKGKASRFMESRQKESENSKLVRGFYLQMNQTPRKNSAMSLQDLSLTCQHLSSGFVPSNSSYFSKFPISRCKVIFDFTARAENDLSVKMGTTVIVLNTDDWEWSWVRCENDLAEGFVPAIYLLPEDDHKSEKFITSAVQNGEDDVQE